jgi:enoyl-CoA hydratase/carnithine racemase
MTVQFEVDNGVAVITLDRPQKLNSVTAQMSAQLLELVERLGTDDEIRVAVLTGSGSRAFCVGSDIGEVGAYPDPWQFRNRRDYCDALRAIRKPVIAAVNGYAYGGGLELALTCGWPAPARPSPLLRSSSAGSVAAG